MSVLAVDLGGSGLKACLFDGDGRPVATARSAIAFDESPEGACEADPERWWEALGKAIERLDAEAGSLLDSTAIIAICGFTRTQVFIDSGGRPVRPAIAFRDRRAAAHGQQMAEQAGSEETESQQLNGFHPLARLAWLKEAEPESWRRTHVVVEPKDYLNFRLTGEAKSDEVSSYWLARAFAGGERSLAARCGFDRDPLPPLGRPLDIAGTVRPGLPDAFGRLAGALVMLGSNDTWAAVAGMDALVAGRAYCVSGSSEVFGFLAPQQARAPGLVTIRWGEALWHLGGPGQNGANTLDWANMVLAGAAEASSRPSPLVFLPFLLGERTPFWDGDLRGAVLGIDAGTSGADISRAVMEGVAHVNRVVLERAESATGQAAREVRIGGGGSRNAAWNQIRADVLGRPVLASTAMETGLAGCLAAARVALGLDPDLSAAARSGGTSFVRYEPDPGRRHWHDELHAIFREAHEAVAPLSRRLAALSRSRR